QRLAPGIKRFYAGTNPAFADFPTTHGMFVVLGARLLRPGGRLAYILPSSVSDLDGYAPTRRAHDLLCAIPGPLTDFGEGRFEHGTQPCMALVSERTPGGRGDQASRPWELARPDLDPEARQLLGRLVAADTLPEELFGERGFQSTSKLKVHLREI